MVIIDELHIMGELGRGYLLELLLTKLMYINKKPGRTPTQIIGMSATLKNIEDLGKQLKATVFTSNFRPVPLQEFCKIGRDIYNHHLEHVRSLPLSKTQTRDPDQITQLCAEIIAPGLSVLVFCPTQLSCNNVSTLLAELLPQVLPDYLKASSMTLTSNSHSNFSPTSSSLSSSSSIVPSSSLVGSLTTSAPSALVDSNTLAEKRREVAQRLRVVTKGMVDPKLLESVMQGVAYHHAGVTLEERSIIETAYREGIIQVLCATSTLAAGVNLPARRVIFRNMRVGRSDLDAVKYKQMSGRAGRAGKDSQGALVEEVRPEVLTHYCMIIV